MADNEIKIIISADIEQARKSLEQLGKVLTQNFSNFGSNISKQVSQSTKSFEQLGTQVSKSTSNVSGEVVKITKTVENFGKKSKDATQDIDLAFRRVTDTMGNFGKQNTTQKISKNLSRGFESLIFPTDEVRDFDAIINRLNTDNLNKGLNALELSMKQLTTYMKGNAIEFNNYGEFVDTLTGKVLKQDQVLRKANAVVKRFNFNWLSVMFAGMALDRVFGSLISKQFQLFGVTELFSSVWTVTLLPLMEMLLPLLLKLAEFMFNLDPAVQKAIGIFILLGAGIGKIFVVIGQFALGIQGLANLLGTGGLSGALSSAGTFIAGLSATALIAIGAIIAIFVGMYLAFKENFLGMQKVVKFWIDGLKQGFGGLITWFKGIWNVIKGIFTGNSDLIIQGLKQIFNGFFNFIIGGFKVVGAVAAAVIIGALRVVVGFIQAIVNLVGSIPTLIGKKKLWDVDWLDSLSVKGSFKTGGTVPETGNYLLHQGEKVIPKNEVNNTTNGSTVFSPVINITTNSNASSTDISRAVSEELNRQWAFKFKGR